MGDPSFCLGIRTLDALDTGSSTARYSDTISAMSMVQLVHSPTHLQPRPTALDHGIANQRDPVPDIEILPDSISDHQPVVVTARLGRVRRRAQWRHLRSWRRADWSAICLDLLLTDWSGVDSATEVNACQVQFMTA